MPKQIKAVAAAMMGSESGVPTPSRARASSFASLVADMPVGDHPAAKAVRVNHLDLTDITADMATLREKLRNSVTSAVASARRRNPGAEYKIELSDTMTVSGIYVLAFVHRVA